MVFIHLHSVEETEARGKVWLVQRTQLSPVVTGLTMELGRPCWPAAAAGRRKGYGQMTKHRISKLGPSVPPA